MKQELEKKFLEIYGNGCRLLCIQLNGFTHRVFYNTGKGTEVVLEETSSYAPELFSKNTKAHKLLGDIPHHEYQGSPKEIVYVTPENI